MGSISSSRPSGCTTTATRSPSASVSPPELVRLSLGGVGGAFGAREDVSLHIHACLLAVRTGRPVKIVYSRAESFLGHVHRHPARIWMRHTAEPDGEIVSFESRILLDGGAYRSSSYHVTANAACFAAGPYRVPNALVHATAVRTNNPPCGAMRGFGVVQSCFAHEAQMDRLAAACGIDPVELRLRNALAPGDELLTGPAHRGHACPSPTSSAPARRCRCRPRRSTTHSPDPAAPGRTADARRRPARRRASRSASRTSCTPRATWTARSRGVASTPAS